MSATRYPSFEATMPVDTRLNRATRVEPGTIVTDDEAEAMCEAGSACSEFLEDEPCSPPFSRVGLVLVLCTGLPLLVVIVWALVAWRAAA